MDMVRVFFDENGTPAAVELRPDQVYSEESIVDELRSLRSEVMTAEQAEALRKQQPEDATAARMQEIRAIDKSALPDEEWLKLFREYATLSGGF